MAHSREAKAQGFLQVRTNFSSIVNPRQPQNKNTQIRIRVHALGVRYPQHLGVLIAFLQNLDDNTL